MRWSWLSRFGVIVTRNFVKLQLCLLQLQKQNLASGISSTEPIGAAVSLLDYHLIPFPAEEGCYETEITLTTITSAFAAIPGIPCSLTCNLKIKATFDLYWHHNRDVGLNSELRTDTCFISGSLCTKARSYERLENLISLPWSSHCRCEVTLRLNRVFKLPAEQYSHLNSKTLDCSIAGISQRFEVLGWQLRSGKVARASLRAKNVDCIPAFDDCLCDWEGETRRPNSQHTDLKQRKRPSYGTARRLESWFFL